ncbi:MAG: FkbM family methyltransferase [Candidatus Nanohaloarchaea archaeon]|nr:FkbM family methyltransferase [Candidatus Nanohaloarchaea archaeon]
MLEKAKLLGRRAAGTFILFFRGSVNRNGVELDLSEVPPRWRKIFLDEEYEAAEEKLLDAYLPRETPVIELGGGAGFIACKTCQLVDAPQAVVEPNPEMMPVLERNRDLNGCDFVIEEKAYHPEEKEVELSIPDSFLGTSLEREGRTIETEATNLEDLVEEHGFEKFSLVIDIEGTEYELLEEEADILEERCEFLVVEFHPFREKDMERYRQKIRDAGFKLLESETTVEAYEKG